MIERSFDETNLSENEDKPKKFSESNRRPTSDERMRAIFSDEPFMNVIPKDLFDERTQSVFSTLGKALARSYGPYGAAAVISEYPMYHITKDGYTIQKNIAFDKTTSYIDQIIAGMAGDICGRLNYSVGDGTTTAVVATNEIYQAYVNLIKRDKRLQKVLPRDIMKSFNRVKDKLVDAILNTATPIRSLSKSELANYIRKIVYVSSNGDEDITNIITDLYKDLGYPAINIEQSPDGVTRKKIIDGFQIDAILTDKIYINSDDMTMKLENADVIVFDHRVYKDEYLFLLKPLSSECKSRGRHLICLAPFYDESMMASLVSPDLNSEFAVNKDINLVLMSYRNTSLHHKKMITNLMMLFNTLPITRDMSNELISKVNEIRTNTKTFEENFPFNLDERGLIGTLCVTSDKDIKVIKKDESYKYFIEHQDEKFRIGFVEYAGLGLKESVFNGFHRNENLYQTYVKDARDDLEAAEKKYQSLGTFNTEISQCQQRLNALELHLGIIEVGGDSTYSKGFNNDVVEDAVKASRSAYNFGVVHGCNQTLLSVLYRMMTETPKDDSTKLDHIVETIIFNGFWRVYRTLITNKNVDLATKRKMSVIHETTDDAEIELDKNRCADAIAEYFSDGFTNADADIYKMMIEDIEKMYSCGFDSVVKELHEINDVADVIIALSILYNKPFDITTGKLSDDIIHSAETDVQILKATCDLINLLITGNQLVISQYGRFNG
nr:MAG TPA: Heat shock protein 60 [Caudoviricetes sp.]